MRNSSQEKMSYWPQSENRNAQNRRNNNITKTSNNSMISNSGGSRNRDHDSDSVGSFGSSASVGSSGRNQYGGKRKPPVPYTSGRARKSTTATTSTASDVPTATTTSATADESMNEYQDDDFEL